MLKKVCTQIRSVWFGWRLRKLGVGLDGKVSLIGSVMPLLRVKGRMNLGDGTAWQGVSYRSEIHVATSGTLSIGPQTFVNQGVTLAVHDAVTLGADCLIGEFVAIHDTSFHSVAPDRRTKSGPVRIGRNVWLGHRVIVLPAVEIGDHTVVGAGAVVTQSLPSRCVAAGVPARVLFTFSCPDDWKRQ